MKDPERMHEIDPGKGAFAQAFGVDMGVLPWLGTPEGADLGRKFSIGVPWLSSITVVATRTDLPWDTFGTTVCDVGCGPGNVMLDVKKRHPHLNIICQDLEPMVPMIKEVKPEKHPPHLSIREADCPSQTFEGYEKAMTNGEIDIQVHDYFTPQETVADVYWLRGVVYEMPSSWFIKPSGC